MDMIKITKDMIPEVQTVEVVGKDGTKVMVKKNIPYDEKQGLAFEMSMYRNVQDQENGIMYDSYRMSLIDAVLLAKYYTNIDTSIASDEDGQKTLFDWLVFNDVYGDIVQITSDDRTVVYSIANAMISAIRNSFIQQHSIMRKLAGLLDVVPNAQKMVDEIAKSEYVNNTMIDLIEAKKAANKSAANSKEKLVTSNGITLNMAKKRIKK